MLKTRSLIPAALLSTFVGLAGCHVSFSSGSGSKAPSNSQAKPARKSPPKKAAPSNTGAKPIQKNNSKPISSAPAKEPTRAPAADKADPGPKRTAVSSDPKRVKPDGPKRTKTHIGNRDKQPVETTVAEPETENAGSVNVAKPGNLKSPG